MDIWRTFVSCWNSCNIHSSAHIVPLDNTLIQSGWCSHLLHILWLRISKMGSSWSSHLQWSWSCCERINFHDQIGLHLFVGSLAYPNDSKLSFCLVSTLLGSLFSDTSPSRLSVYGVAVMISLLAWSITIPLPIQNSQVMCLSHTWKHMMYFASMQCRFPYYRLPHHFLESHRSRSPYHPWSRCYEITSDICQSTATGIRRFEFIT